MTISQLKDLVNHKKFFVWKDEERRNLIKIICVLYEPKKKDYEFYLENEAPFMYINYQYCTINRCFNPGSFYQNRLDSESVKRVIETAKCVCQPFKNQEELSKALDKYGCWIYYKSSPLAIKPQKHYMIVGYDNSSVTICDQSEVKTISFDKLSEDYYFRSSNNNCGTYINLLEEELK